MITRNGRSTGGMIEEDHDLKLVGKAHNGEEICNIIREKNRM